MVVERIFISSVMNGYAAERQAARDAVESLDMQALMAGGTAPASPEPSRTALLAQIDRADAVVLILGERYGFITESGRSPTEDEFDYARETHTPVFVFVQEGVTQEPEQLAFIRRVQGGWRDGTFTGSFRDPSQLALGVVRALASFRSEQQGGDATSAAQERAESLALGDGRLGGAGGPTIRVVLAPVGGVTVIDALVLDDAGFMDRVARIVRDCGVVSQASGIEMRATSAGIALSASSTRDFQAATINFAADGAVVTELDARGEGTMGAMVISYPKVQQRIASTCAVAQALWSEVPTGDRIRHICAVVAVADAPHSPLSTSGRTGGSIRTPIFSTPIHAPDPPRVFRRADVGASQTNRWLAVVLKQAYADRDAVIE